ncbi:MAG: hypothetical protein ACRCVV_12175, partial [Shewanella sp.]
VLSLNLLHFRIYFSKQDLNSKPLCLLGAKPTGRQATIAIDGFLIIIIIIIIRGQAPKVLRHLLQLLVLLLLLFLLLSNGSLWQPYEP